jgi:homoserine O-acetyltransferase
MSVTPLKTVMLPTPLALDGGQVLEGVGLAWEAWGSLNAARDNAVLICHALTGDQFVAGPNPVTGRPAWWGEVVGPGKAIDPARDYVICTNVLGGCMGSTGPTSLDAEGRPWGRRFPVITIADMVRAQAMALEALGITRLKAVVGGSMGGMQALEWARAFPERVAACVAIATTARHSAQNIAFYEVGRQAVMADPDWCDGDYLAQGKFPRAGLGVARMAAHITYVSETSLKRRFDRQLRGRERPSFGFEADFQVESYLRHQATRFVDRFDANSYLYITRAMDYFDLWGTDPDGLARTFQGSPVRFGVFAFSSDWHYPPQESRALVQGLHGAGADVSYLEVETDTGHDAFLLEEPGFQAALAGFLGWVAP